MKDMKQALGLMDNFKHPCIHEIGVPKEWGD